MIQQGELLAGKYRVEQVLGAGGMGYVVAAMHEQLGQRVAVKLLVPELCENEDSVMRFLREARAAVKIHSEHVARVIDVGELTNGSPYMVMEFLNGRDLADELDQPGAVLPVEVAIDYVLQASEAVAEAHSLGVIHRDLKPANLFLTHRPDGSPLVKVLDFGISKAINAEDNALEPAPSLTATHSLLGSPAYMSPEQIRRPKHVDTRTDIWSLGSILYELLTKDPPFNADSPLALLAAVVSDPLPSVRDKRPDVSLDLEAVIAKCLEKNPDNRYQTVAELADALAPFAPRSQPSVSRISGILRATSMRPAAADKSPSSERTLQSPGTPRSGTPISEQATEEVKVKVITPAPAARSTKNTNTDWVATPSMVASRRRTAVVTLAALAAAVVGIVVLWLHPGPATTEATPDPSTVKATPRSAPAVEAPARSAAAAPVAPETPSAAAASAAPAAPSVIPSASTPVVAAKNAPKMAAKGAPAAPAVAAPAPTAAAPVTPAPPKAAVADPLDGRR